MKSPVDRVSLYAAAMECCWLAGLLLALDGVLADPHGLALASVILLYPLAHALASLLRHFRARAWMEWGLSLVLLLCIWIWIAAGPLPGGEDIAVKGTDFRRVFTGLAAGIAWMRGWLLQHRRLEPHEVGHGFHLGLVALLPAALLSEVSSELILLSVAFVAFAVLAHRQARADAHHDQGGAHLGVAVPLIALACAVVVGLAIASMVNRQLLGELLTLPAWLASQVGAMLGSPGDVPLDVEEPDSEGRGRKESPFAVRATPEWVHWLFALFTDSEALLGTLIFLAMVAIIGFVMWFIWRRLRRQDQRSSEGLRYEHSSMGLRAALLLMLQLLWRQMGRGLGWLAGLPARLRSRVMPAGDAHSVSGMYRLALARLARRGWKRAAHESPEEYQRRLQAAWLASPEAGPGEQEFAVLTTAFVADCYGPRRLAVGSLAGTWHQLSKRLNAVKPRRNKDRKQAKEGTSK